MIIVFGSINIDLIFPVPALPAPGETVLTPEGRIEPGGKGANQAVAAARDGASVALAGAVGEDPLAAMAVAGLQQAGVELSRVHEVLGHTGTAAISVDRVGRNHVVAASGANLLARAEQVEDAVLRPGNTLVVQLETEATETAGLILRGRARGTRIILNLAPAGPLPPETLRAVDVLVVNQAEAAWLGNRLGTGVNPASLHQALGVAVVCTLGSGGVAAAASGLQLRLPAHPVQAVDSTAAGDCFTGVLAAGLDRGLTLEAAMRRANVAAGLCCTRRGTQSSLPLAAEIDAAL